MAKYSKRRRSRRGSKRKRRGGTVGDSMSDAADSLEKGVGDAGTHMTNAGRKLQATAAGFGSDLKGAMRTVHSNLVGTARTATEGLSSAASGAEQGISTGFASAEQGVEGLGKSVGFSGGRGRGGSGRCCFPAKFCGSRKRKGNKRRSIRTGRCCLPVKSKKCGAKKKNGRKTKKNKRKRKSGMFNMFGG